MTYSNFYARLYNVSQRVGEAINSTFKFIPARIYFVLISLFQILAWTQAFFIRRRLSGDLLILHYNIDFGVDLVGNPSKIFLYPVFGLAAMLINIIIVFSLARRKESNFIIHMFLGSALACAAFLSLALLSIDFINFR